MTAFSLAIFLAGEPLMHYLFDGTDFEGHGQTLTVLAVATSVGPLATTATIAMATMERARTILLVSALEAALTVLLVWMFMVGWGPPGVAYATLTKRMLVAFTIDAEGGHRHQVVADMRAVELDDQEVQLGQVRCHPLGQPFCRQRHEPHLEVGGVALGLRRHPGRQRKYMAVEAAHPRAMHGNFAAMEAELAFGLASPRQRPADHHWAAALCA